MTISESTMMRRVGEGRYAATTFPECEFGQTIEPSTRFFEFETDVEAMLFAAAHGYAWENRNPPFYLSGGLP